ncbi:hypothetical protein BX600DRAFT_96916 [Xylariales sp. PMI_506]|nr:hypothetical protein BX600DRAFT_96916 [Xylariales sp. PMI_506]
MAFTFYRLYHRRQGKTYHYRTHIDIKKSTVLRGNVIERSRYELHRGEEKAINSPRLSKHLVSSIYKCWYYHTCPRRRLAEAIHNCHINVVWLLDRPSLPKSPSRRRELSKYYLQNPPNSLDIKRTAPKTFHAQHCRAQAYFRSCSILLACYRCTGYIAKRGTGLSKSLHQGSMSSSYSPLGRDTRQPNSHCPGTSQTSS